MLNIKDSLNRIVNDWYLISIPKSAIQDLAEIIFSSTYSLNLKPFKYFLI